MGFELFKSQFKQANPDTVACKLRNTKYVITTIPSGKAIITVASTVGSAVINLEANSLSDAIVECYGIYVKLENISNIDYYLLQQKIDHLVRYLYSSKFDLDTTVQVQDILNRIQ